LLERVRRNLESWILNPSNLQWHCNAIASWIGVKEVKAAKRSIHPKYAEIFGNFGEIRSIHIIPTITWGDEKFDVWNYYDCCWHCSYCDIYNRSWVQFHGFDMFAPTQIAYKEHTWGWTKTLVIHSDFVFRFQDLVNFVFRVLCFFVFFCF